MRENIYEDLTIVRSRGRTTYFVVGALFVFLVLIFWKIQILDHNKYWELSEANHIRETRIPPQRGKILARDDETILAKNHAAFMASVVRERISDRNASLAKISALLDLEIDTIVDRLDKFSGFPIFYPIVIKDNLDLEEVARIESRQLELPELIVQVEPKRDYPYNHLAAHVLGYMQEISLRELKTEQYRQRRPGDMVGKTGIERQYEAFLVGKEGRLLEIVDSTGRSRDIVSREDPQNGKDISLTLDIALQQKAEELLAGREGAIVVMKPDSGEILAMSSYPTFDPNSFINRFTPEEWQELTTNVANPLENRAIRGLYAPGSIFKIVLALGALDMATLNERTSFYCSGSTIIYGHPFSCWFGGGHGAVNLYTGIQQSCNVYFYNVGKNMGIDAIAKYARQLGLGRATGVDLFGEKAGLVPDPDWKQRVRGEPWYPGETISVSIGQGPIQVTPLQIAVLTAAIARRGEIVTPRFLLRVHGGRGEGEAARVSLTINTQIFDKVIRGMWLAANREGGTARGAGIPGFDVCGKTGSTQVISRATAEKLGEGMRLTKTHSWFSGFAPRDDPEVVVTIIVEYGGMGGTTAAPMARELFRIYRERYD